MRIADRIADIPASPTLAISAKAAELKRAGVDVVSFSAGEPDFDTAASICEAATSAMKAGRTHYTPVGGAPELKEAICAHYKRKTGFDFTPAECVASCGAKHTLYNLFLSILNDGDEVIIPAPYWVSYPTQVRIAGGVPVEVSGAAENGFVPSVADLEAARTANTRAIVINNPTNPTGAFWDRSQLTEIAEWLKANPNIIVISDAIYDELIYDDLEYTELLNIAPELRDRYVIVNGVSKAFAMTGWRLGYALAPPAVVSAMQKIQSQSTSNPTSVTQFATIEALKQGEAVIAPMRREFTKRRDLIYKLLTDIPGVKLVKPRGAFYAFPDISSTYGKSANGHTIESDMDFATYLLDTVQVAVVPGGAFGAPGFIRMSYASSEASITEGVTRIARAIAALS